MKLRQLMRHLVPVLIAAALALSPFAVATSADGSLMAGEPAMAHDMPCWPAEQPAAADCADTCPLMTVCSAGWFGGVPILSAALADLNIRGDAIRPVDDLDVGPLAEGPPARPPRT